MKRIASIGLGKLAIVFTLAIIAFILVTFGQQMFSSGPLSEQNRKNVTRGGVRSHAEITSCSACHVSPFSSDTMATRCMSCHDTIRDQLDGDKPMHGKLAQGRQCTSCHTEHKGAHAALTSFAKFDHACAAFKLTGKHAVVDCKSCHVDSVYQGAPQTCVACHAEPSVHQGKFGTDCSQCHTPNTWRTTAFNGATMTSGKFNHDLTGFKLTGKHAVTDCKSCHIKESFKGLSRSCVSCHAEPKVHMGKFGTDCMQCHSTVNWKSVALGKNAFTSGKFNHDLTGFKLTGKHKSADCKSCHTGSTFKGTPQTCMSCHAEPVSHKPHPKNFGSDCAQCHSTLAWQGAMLTKHTFPMNHRTKNRQNSACKVCHAATIDLVSLPPDTAKLSPSYATYTCYGCHHHTPEKEARSHANRKVANLNNCAFCHPTGRGTKRKAALEETLDVELCRGCPEASGGLVPAACPSFGIGALLHVEREVHAGRLTLPATTRAIEKETSNVADMRGIVRLYWGK